jgi:hypothetical protein
MAATGYASVGLPPEEPESPSALPIAAAPTVAAADAEEAAWLAERARLAMSRAREPSASPSPTPSEASETAAPTPEAEPTAEESQIRKISYRPGPSIHTAAVLALIVEHFPADQIGNAMAVARCESGHSNAIGAANANGTRDWGIFQLNDGGTLQGALRRIGVSFDTTVDAQQLALDAETNVRAARDIYDSRGWAPWVCAQKTGIVASLYTRTSGPMDGRYDERGLVGTVDLARTLPDYDATLPTPEVPQPTPTAAATPSPTASQTPSPSASATQSPTPTGPSTGSPTPTPTESSTQSPSPTTASPTPTADSTPTSGSTSTSSATATPTTSASPSPATNSTATPESMPTKESATPAPAEATQ